MSAIPRLNPSDYSIDELRDRRDLAIRDSDTELAMACAIAIDKKRGYYGHTAGPPERGRQERQDMIETLLLIPAAAALAWVWCEATDEMRRRR